MVNVFEVWKEIHGFGGKYSVSNAGRIKNNWRGNVFKLFLNTGGYPVANLRYKRHRTICQVHRLVAKAFIPNPENKKTVNHKNGIRYDNRIDNLEWATYSEQQYHAYSALGKVGAMTGRPSHLNSNAKKIIAIFKDGSIKEYGSLKDFSVENNVIYTNASRVLRGKQKHINNIKLKYHAVN